jgi:hypothetical protein
MTGHDDLLTAADDNRREFSRVSAYVPFSYRVVSPADADYLKSRTINDSFLTDFKTTPNVEDQLYGEWLRLINAKLDEIIRMLAMQREGFAMLPFKPISISGNGLSFFSKERHEKGEIIEARIVLTILNAVALFLYGEVVTIETADGGWQIAIRFINMDDLIRNEIIRFVFEREREVIREKRGA